MRSNFFMLKTKFEERYAEIEKLPSYGFSLSNDKPTSKVRQSLLSVIRMNIDYLSKKI